MPRQTPPPRPLYRLPIPIIQAGVERAAGDLVDLSPAQIVQVEEAARAAGALPILTDPDQTAPEEGTQT